MAKKIITPEEYKAKLEKKASKRKRFVEAFLKTLAFALAIALVFSASTIAHTRIEKLSLNKTVQTNGGLKDGFEDDGYDNGGSTGSNSGDSTASSNSDNAGSTGASSDSSNSTDASSEDAKNFELFVKAFKGVKTNAKSATLVKKNAYNYNNHVKANPIIEAAAAPLLSSLLKEEDVNETYTGADIAAKFPPSGTTCGLTQNDVKKITCKEEGNYYIIEVIVKGSKNPEAGKSVGAVASIITKQSIQDPIKNIPAINSLEPTCDYHDTTARAKIEKSTGNCVEYYCQLPMILIMSNDRNSYEIGLGFEEWWTIAY